MKHLIVLFFLLSFSAYSFEWTLSVGGSALDNYVVFQVNSTVSASLPCPLMTEAQRNAVGSGSGSGGPNQGACIYNTDSDRYNFYDLAAVVWREMGGLPVPTAGQILVGSGGGWLARSITGDISIDQGGGVSINSGVIFNTHINVTAGIAFSKMENLNTDEIMTTDPSGFGSSSGVSLTEAKLLIGETYFPHVAGSGFQVAIFDPNNANSVIGSGSGFRWDGAKLYIDALDIDSETISSTGGISLNPTGPNKVSISTYVETPSIGLNNGQVYGVDSNRSIFIVPTGTGQGFVSSGFRVAGNLFVGSGNQFQLQDDTNANQVNIQALSGLASDYTLTLPPDDGSVNQVLKTDGSGVLSWTAVVPSYSSVVKNADYAILSGDGYTHIYDTGAGSGTWTLPPLADNINRNICFSHMNTSKTSSIVAGSGAGTIGDLASIELDFEGAFVCVIGTTPAWQITAQNLTAFYKTYSLTVTGANYTPVKGEGTFFRNITGDWFVFLEINGTFSPGTSSTLMTIADLIFDDGAGFFQGWGCAEDSTAYGCRAYPVQNSSTFYFSAGAGTATGYGMSGWAKLKARPAKVE
jgi:hypothetical protein